MHLLCPITSSGACGALGTLDLPGSKPGGGWICCHCMHSSLPTRVRAVRPQWSCFPCLCGVFPGLQNSWCVLWALAAQDFQYAKEGWPLLLQLFVKWYVSVVTLRVISETAAADGKSPKCKSYWHVQRLTSDSSEKILRNLGTVAHDGLFLVWPVSPVQLYFCQSVLLTAGGLWKCSSSLGAFTIPALLIGWRKSECDTCKCLSYVLRWQSPGVQSALFFPARMQKIIVHGCWEQKIH